MKRGVLLGDADQFHVRSFHETSQEARCVSMCESCDGQAEWLVILLCQRGTGESRNEQAAAGFGLIALRCVIVLEIRSKVLLFAAVRKWRRCALIKRM